MRCTAVLGVVVVVVVVMSRQGASHASWNVRVSRSQGESIDIHNKLAQGALFRHHLSNRTAGMVCVLQILSWFFLILRVYVCTLCGVTIGIGEKGSVALLGLPARLILGRAM